MAAPSKFKIPIGFKLVSMAALLLALTSFLITYQGASRFEKISLDHEEDSNRDQSRARATEVESVFIGYIDKIKLIAYLLMKTDATPEAKARDLRLTFNTDQDLVVVEVVSRDSNPAAPVRVINEEYLKRYELDSSYIDRLRRDQNSKKIFDTAAVFAGDIQIKNSSRQGGVPLITIGVPIVKDEMGQVSHIVLAEVRMERLQKVFGNVSERVIYLIDKEGKLLAHPSEDLVFRGESLSAVPIVKAALESQFKQGQLQFVDPVDHLPYTGAFTKTALGISVIAQASEAVILEAARAVRREAFYIAGQILSVTFFLVFLFSFTLTSPLEKLVGVTEKVAQGNFRVRANIKSRDEVGQLGQAVDSMIVGLEERDRVKNMFAKFHGSRLAEDLLKREAHLGGNRKEVTVFFSDIRDFTQFSEGHTPEQVVDMLNEYFQVMVEIISRNNGVVDKFIGDAIMAVWGAPHSSGQDTEDAMRACVEMRVALEVLNDKRMERNEHPIRIGMGLHRGSAISGTIGSNERMEYTVIGDTVNQASRIEASTKSLGTDLLISEEVAEQVLEKFWIEEAGRVEVKGKAEPLTLFLVKGILQGEQFVEIRTPYSDYPAENADKVKVV